MLEVLRDKYQKPLNEKRVDQIVAAFDENIANEPKVSHRDGHYYVFDGQHTVAARVKRNGGNPLRIRCKVYNDLTIEQEALLFAAQTGIAAKPTPGDRLRAKLFAEEEEAVSFTKATERAGFLFNLDGGRSDDHISCINTALKMFKKIGSEKYEEALVIIRAAWCGYSESLRNEIITAVCEFIRVYHEDYNRHILICALRAQDPENIIDSIKTNLKYPGYKKYVIAILICYNRICGPKKLSLKF